MVGVGVLLESGPIMNSSGHPDAAVMLFRQTATMLFRRAATIAYWAELPLPRVDARHMLAIVDPDGAEDWTAQAAASLRSHPIPAPAAGSPGCGSRTHADPPPALLPRP